MHVLVTGPDINVLKNIKRGLTSYGIAAKATMKPEHASIDFDAKHFHLVAFVGTVDTLLREMLGVAFARQNPDVILLDTVGPVAVQHILATLNTDPQKAKFASRFQITEQDGSYILHLDLKRECDVCVDAYEFSSDFRGVTLGKGHLFPGPFVFNIRDRDVSFGINMLVVTLGGTEFYVSKVER